MRYILFTALLLFFDQSFGTSIKKFRFTKVSQLICHGGVTRIIFHKKFEDGGVEVVFIRKRRRYTIYSSCNKKDQFLAIWVRKNGTYGWNTLETVSDNDFDGEVDFGGSGKDFLHKQYIGPSFYNDHSVQGRENFIYWQKFYRQTVIEILAHFNIK